MTLYATLREANIARQADWGRGQPKLDLAFRGVELAGEAGEVCNVIKKLERERHGWSGTRDTVAHLAEELADMVICADLVAIDTSIDLDRAVVEKFNATSEKVGLPQRLAGGDRVSAAVRDVLAERQRQSHDEGWSASHDDTHLSGELAVAASCYALWDAFKRVPLDIAGLWPWSRAWWKPKDQRRNLVRAAALLIAEIERLDRRPRIRRESA